MPLTLRDLEACFRRLDRHDELRSSEDPDIKLSEADGLRLLCPKCYLEEPAGPVGCHSIICWFVGRVPDHLDPRPGRWVPSGSGIADLTFIGPSSASVALLGGCNAHFFIRDGAIVPA